MGTLFTTTEKRNYTGLKNAGKLYKLEAAVNDAKAMLENIRNDVNAPDWAEGSALDSLERAENALEEFHVKVMDMNFADFSEEDQNVIMLSLGLKVDRLGIETEDNDIIGEIVTAKNGDDLKNAVKKLSDTLDKKCRAYEMRDKSGKRVPLIEVWHGMLYSGLKVKKAGLAPTLRKDESYRKEARKYVAFCILG